ncbi:duf1777-domain-containing protein [Nannochloropsis oceanica]
MSNPSSLPSLPPPSLLLTGAVLKRKNNGTQSQSQSQSQPAFPTRGGGGGGEGGRGKGIGIENLRGSEAGGTETGNANAAALTEKERKEDAAKRAKLDAEYARRKRMEVLRQIQGDSYQDEEEEGREEAAEYQALFERRREGLEEEGEEEMDEDDEAKMMQTLLGFSHFDTTHEKPVEDNQKGAAKGAVAKSGRRTYRQYMNRRGGFNRALDKRVTIILLKNHAHNLPPPSAISPHHTAKSRCCGSFPCTRCFRACLPCRPGTRAPRSSKQLQQKQQKSSRQAEEEEVEEGGGEGENEEKEVNEEVGEVHLEEEEEVEEERKVTVGRRWRRRRGEKERGKEEGREEEEEEEEEEKEEEVEEKKEGEEGEEKKDWTEMEALTFKQRHRRRRLLDARVVADGAFPLPLTCPMLDLVITRVDPRAMAAMYLQAFGALQEEGRVDRGRVLRVL